ncbi:hypothetical protein ATG66_2608 [Vibrio sp. ES.051]|uniref:ankyrin repeat domain-containing protein n=1 Tax=Vibrio sp. ES.051 TaxID=1761909 RepID=UPI000BF51F32|nr:ankyrin repeat domain-containing protein [Vibrio sp. ES.051]PFG56279.1 hypothetical protein ATG66_2608 [Vibrio sp. ES.051]
MNSNISLSLHDLVKAGSRDDVIQQLETGALIESRDDNGCTPLMIAVQNNNIDMVKVLLERGADVNARDVTMLTPYLCAGANGFHDLLSLTLLHGADVTSINRFGGTPLLPSSEKGFLRTVQVSLAAGIPVNHANKLGWSALLEAVVLGDGGYLYGDVIDMLLSAGADQHLKDRDGISALQHAKARQQTRVVALMTDAEAVRASESAALREVKAHLAAFEYEDALGVLTAKPSEFTDRTGYHYYCGYVLMELGRYQDAIDAYRQGLSLSDNPAEFHLYIANSYRLAKQSEQALAEFDLGIAANPRSPFVRYHKSNYLRELGMHQTAVETMYQLLAAEPSRYDYSFHLSNSLRSLGRHSEAVCAIENAITHDYTNALYYLHKGKSLELLGKNKQALMVINYAIDVCDDSSELLDVKQQLLN